MGSQFSSNSDKTAVDELQEMSWLFSDFRGNTKQNYCHDKDSLNESFFSSRKSPVDYDSYTMQNIVNLWCSKCSISKWNDLNRALKNQLIQDFLDTVYCTSHAFDEVFLLLFTSTKSRQIMGVTDRTLPSRDFRAIVEDVLRYSSTVGLKYYSYSNDIRTPESIADFPLKTFSLCPCTRRPLYVAMYLGKPDVVQLLLKYGARIYYEDVCNCMQDARHPLRNVLDVLKTNFECTRKFNSTSEATMIRTKSSIQSLIYLRVDLNHCSSLWPSVMNILRELGGHVSSDAIPSLKHICRTRIRETMRGNIFLYHPHIWNILRLPQTLIAYMNLDYTDSFV